MTNETKINHEKCKESAEYFVANGCYTSNIERMIYKAYLDLKAENERLRGELKKLDDIVELQHQNPKLTKGSYDYQCGFLNALEAVKQARLPTPPKD